MPEVVVIGTSTGGPQALRALVPQLPADFPAPIGIVLHMPVGYTEMYARKLDEMSPLTVIEAQGGEAVIAGVVYLAPAGRHLTFRRGADGTVRTQLDLRPLDTPHRPSVDVLFQSAAEAYGERVLAVVLTGMGADGREGSAWIKAKGGIGADRSGRAPASCTACRAPSSRRASATRVSSLERMAQGIMDRL